MRHPRHSRVFTNNATQHTENIHKPARTPETFAHTHDSFRRIYAFRPQLKLERSCVDYIFQFPCELYV